MDLIKVLQKKIKWEKGIYFLTSEQEKHLILAPGDIQLKNKEDIEKTSLRKGKEFVNLDKKRISFISTNTNQMISIGTGLIPFLEHNDANRALMGSNMQRQAVAPIFKERPFLRTGLENNVAKNSETTITTNFSGIIKHVDNKKIIIYEEIKFKKNTKQLNSNSKCYLKKFAKKKIGKETCKQIISFNRKTYFIEKNKKSNQNTQIKQKSIVQRGDWVKKGKIIAEGTATTTGNLALGKNLLVGYLGWEGYNFEDAIIINERLVKENLLTSNHIKKYKTFLSNNEIGNVRTNKVIIKN